MSEPGLLEACFSMAGGHTALSRLRCAAPLKIARTFARDDGIEVCVMDASPGMLAGDRYALQWRLEADTQVALTTQGFTRVHPSRDAPCVLRQTMDIGARAWLDYCPEPLMLYQDAALRAETEIDLAADATLLLSEIVCAGRIGHGEAFRFHSFANRLHVRRDGELIFVNHSGLQPERADWQAPGGWQEYTHQGNFYIFSAYAGDALLEGLREVLGAPDSAVWGGVSDLDDGGLAVAMLGHRAWDLQQATQRMRALAHAILKRPCLSIAA